MKPNARHARVRAVVSGAADLKRWRLDGSYLRETGAKFGCQELPSVRRFKQLIMANPNREAEGFPVEYTPRVA